MLTYLNYTVTGRARRANRARTLKTACAWAISAALVMGFTVWAVNVAVI